MEKCNVMFGCRQSRGMQLRLFRSTSNATKGNKSTADRRTRDNQGHYSFRFKTLNIQASKNTTEQKGKIPKDI